MQITTAKKRDGKVAPTIVMFGKVAAGPQAGARVGLGSVSFSEKALWKTFPILEGCGITQEFILQANSAPDPISVIAEALEGKTIEATVIVDQWQGQDRNKLDAASPAQAQAAYSAPQQDPALQTTDVQPPAQPQGPQGVAHTPSF